MERSKIIDVISIFDSDGEEISDKKISDKKNLQTPEAEVPNFMFWNVPPLSPSHYSDKFKKELEKVNEIKTQLSQPWSTTPKKTIPKSSKPVKNSRSRKINKLKAVDSGPLDKFVIRSPMPKTEPKIECSLDTLPDLDTGEIEVFTCPTPIKQMKLNNDIINKSFETPKRDNFARRQLFFRPELKESEISSSVDKQSSMPCRKKLILQSLSNQTDPEELSSNITPDEELKPNVTSLQNNTKDSVGPENIVQKQLLFKLKTDEAAAFDEDCENLTVLVKNCDINDESVSKHNTIRHSKLSIPSRNLKSQDSKSRKTLPLNKKVLKKDVKLNVKRNETKFHIVAKNDRIFDIEVLGLNSDDSVSNSSTLKLDDDSESNTTSKDESGAISLPYNETKFHLVAKNDRIFDIEVLGLNIDDSVSNSSTLKLDDDSESNTTSKDESGAISLSYNESQLPQLTFQDDETLDSFPERIASQSANIQNQINVLPYVGNTSRDSGLQSDGTLESLMPSELLKPQKPSEDVIQDTRSHIEFDDSDTTQSFKQIEKAKDTALEYNLDNLPDINDDSRESCHQLDNDDTLESFAIGNVVKTKPQKQLSDSCDFPESWIEMEDDTSESSYPIKCETKKRAQSCQFVLDTLPDINSDSSQDSITLHHVTNKTLQSTKNNSKITNVNKTSQKVVNGSKSVALHSVPSCSYQTLPDLEDFHNVPSCSSYKAIKPGLSPTDVTTSAVNQNESTIPQLPRVEDMRFIPSPYNNKGNVKENGANSINARYLAIDQNKRIFAKYNLSLGRVYIDLCRPYISATEITSPKKNNLKTFCSIIHCAESDGPYSLEFALHLIEGTVLPNFLIKFLIETLEDSNESLAAQIFKVLINSLRLSPPKDIEKSIDFWNLINKNLTNFLESMRKNEKLSLQSVYLVKYLISALAIDVQRRSTACRANKLRTTFPGKFIGSSNNRVLCITYLYGELLKMICDKENSTFSLTEDDYIFLLESFETLIKIAFVTRSEFLELNKIVAGEVLNYYEKLPIDKREYFLKLMLNMRLIRYFMCAEILVRNFGFRKDTNSILVFNFFDVIMEHLPRIGGDLQLDKQLEFVFIYKHLLFDYVRINKEQLHWPIYARKKATVIFPHVVGEAFSNVASFIDYLEETLPIVRPELLRHPICQSSFALLKTFWLFERLHSFSPFTK